MREWFAERWADIGLIALLSLLAAYFTFPTWSTGLAGGTDFLGHIYKARFLADCWRDYGVFQPLWSSTWYTGYPFLQLYPPLSYYLMAIVSFLFHNDGLAAKMLIVAAYLISGTAMYCGISGLFKNRLAGFLAGAAFIMYPFRTAHGIAGGNLPFMLAISFAPLMITTAMRASREVSWRNIIPASSAAAVVLICHLNTFFLFALLVAAYLVWVWLVRDTPRRRFVIFMEQAKLAVGIGIMTCLFTAFWLIPFIPQATATLISEYSPTIAKGSAIRSVADFVNPAQAGNYISAYAGVFLLIVVVLGFLLTDVRRDKRAVFFLAAGSAALALAVFKDVRVYAYLPLGKMIVPGRMLYIASVTLPAAFGLAGAALVEKTKGRWRPLPVTFIGGLLAVLITFGLFLDFAPARRVFRLSYSIPASYRQFLDQSKKLGGTARIFETEAAWNTYVYAPALTGRESLEGWYLEGSAIRNSLAMINNSLIKDTNPRLIPPLLDYLNTGYVLVPKASGSERKLLRTGAFKSRWHNKTYDLLALKRPPEPVTARRPVRFIGKSPGDQYLSLAQLNGGGDFVPAPLAESNLDQFLDDRSWRGYPAVFLYGYNYAASRPDEGPLAEYVKNGGTVFVCPDGSPDSSQTATKSLFGATVRVAESKGRMAWRLTSAAARQGVDKVDFKRFSPAVWEGKAWSYSYFEGTTPLITANGRVVAGEKKVGRGKVVFIGFNLPYHTAYYKNAAEAALLCSIIDSYLPRQPRVKLTRFVKQPYGLISAVVETGDERPAWLMVSEAYNAGWRATVNGRPAKLNQADPAMITLPVAGSRRYQIELSYRPSVWHYVGIATSAASFLVALAFSLFPRLRGWFKNKWPLLYHPEEI